MRIIINNESALSATDAMIRVYKLIQEYGENGEKYCDLVARFDDCDVISGRTKKGTYTFLIKDKIETDGLN